MGDIHDDLRDSLAQVVAKIDGLSEKALAGNVYSYCRHASHVERACYEFLREHGPALLARQEGDDRLRDLHHAIRLVYGCVPNLPIDESTMDAATDALHNFCLMVGIHNVDVDSPIDEAARSCGRD